MRLIGCVLLVLFVGLAYADDGVEYYSDKYDYVDPDEILVNDRLREQYYKCFMDTGPCVTPDAKFFKGNFAEVIVTKCKKCTEKQKINFNKTADWYTKNQPDKWNAFVEKFVKEAQQTAE